MLTNRAPSDLSRAGRVRRDERGGASGFAAFLLIVAATVLVALAGILWAVATVVLGPTRWLEALETSKAYEQAPVAIAAQLSTSRRSGGGGALAALEDDDVRALVTAAVPPAWLREQAGVVIPPLIEGIADTGEIRASVSLTGLKARLGGPPMQAAVLERIDTWPACGVSQLQQLATGTLPRCRPPAELREQLQAVVAEALAAVADEVPEQVDLAQLLPAGDPGGGGDAAAGSARVATMVDAIRSVAAARPFVATLAMLAVLLLAAATLAAGVTIGSILGTWATPLVAGGAVIAVLGWLADPVLRAVVDTGRASAGAGGGGAGLVGIGGTVAEAMVAQVSAGLLTTGIGLLVAGSLLLAVRWILARG